ncbi:MAG: N-acetyl-gamma-glutamyl-phosphate reductase [Oscillospiraceae bacterium]|jgi:N-acetyl-gamma-glutamyl-phosphate reductase|nr:N-acetyl-gamma-glutamyl-phosphate reductase [Oscillospiraceae bacterium]
MPRIFIDGAAGTTGLVLEQRLRGIPGMELILLPEDYRKNAEARRRAIAASDVTFLCLPDAAAREAVCLAEGTDTILIDASTAHRTAPGWAYGFPELSAAHRKAVQTSNRIAVPGCHAGGVIALVYPLVAAGVLDAAARLHCFSLTGYTGGGKGMIADYEAAPRRTDLEAPRQYALSQAHKHLPEICALCGLQNAPVFSPIVGAFPRGMEVTVQLHRGDLAESLSVPQLNELYTAHYKDAQLITVGITDESGFLTANALAGQDRMQIAAFGSEERILLIARFDNLGKGASGAALQCMNLRLGLAEATGLSV